MVRGWRLRLRRPEARRPQEIPPRYRVKDRPPARGKKWFGWLLPFIVFAGVPGYLWFQSYGVLEARGVVRGRVVEVGTHVEGVLSKVMVEMGDRVKKGQPLASIDIREVDAVVKRRRSELAEARAMRDKLRSDHRRNERLAKQGYESAEVAESSYHAWRAAEAAVLGAEAAVDAAEARKDLAVIHASVDGVVLWEPLGPGTVVDRDDAVVSILDDRDLHVVAYVAEDARGKIHAGQEVEIRVEGIPDQVIKGRVSFLYRGVKFRPRGLRTYDTPAETYQPIKIVPDNPRILRAHGGQGMRAEVRIHLD